MRRLCVFTTTQSLRIRSAVYCPDLRNCLVFYAYLNKITRIEITSSACRASLPARPVDSSVPRGLIFIDRANRATAAGHATVGRACVIAGLKQSTKFGILRFDNRFKHIATGVAQLVQITFRQRFQARRRVRAADLSPRAGDQLVPAFESQCGGYLHIGLDQQQRPLGKGWQWFDDLTDAGAVGDTAMQTKRDIRSQPRRDFK